MIRFFAKRRHRKGFTLTELIVATALIGIIMASVVAFAGPIRTMLKNTNAKSDTNRICKVLGDYIQNRLAYANYIDIYVGMPYDNTTTINAEYTKISASYTALKNKMQDTEPVAGVQKVVNDSRIMYFHYVPNIDGDTTKSTFLVYDIPVTKDDTIPTDFAAFKNKFANVDATTGVIDTTYLLYDIDFYGGYEYFFTMDDQAVKSNDLKKRVFLNFRVDSYNCEGVVQGTVGSETVPISFQPADISGYHAYVEECAESPLTAHTNPMDAYMLEKTGSENISFSLERVH